MRLSKRKRTTTVPFLQFLKLQQKRIQSNDLTHHTPILNRLNTTTHTLRGIVYSSGGPFDHINQTTNPEAKSCMEGGGQLDSMRWSPVAYFTKFIKNTSLLQNFCHLVLIIRRQHLNLKYFLMSEILCRETLYRREERI